VTERSPGIPTRRRLLAAAATAGAGALAGCGYRPGGGDLAWESSIRTNGLLGPGTTRFAVTADRLFAVRNQSGRTYDFETETWRNVENATVSAVDGTGATRLAAETGGRRSLRRPLPSVRCSSLWKGTSHRDRPRRGGDRPRRAGDDRRDRRRRDRVGRRDPLAGQCRRNGRIERVRRVKQIGASRAGRAGRKRRQRSTGSARAIGWSPRSRDRNWSPSTPRRANEPLASPRRGRMAGTAPPTASRRGRRRRRVGRGRKRR